MSQIKEIYCMPHSHFDLGYTHPQSMLVELQHDYIDNAIDLCLATKDNPKESQFKWTCEATYPLMGWLETASKEKKQQLKQLVTEKRICITALPLHTTPGVNVVQIIKLMDNLEYLRKEFNADIDIAINHDVNGQPWTFNNILLDHGINFYLTGINIHFGGVPGPRPMAFNWQSQDNRNLVSYLGEHYSLFSQFFYTEDNSTARMHQGVCEHIKYLEKIGYKEDYVFLTATNPPMFDNNCPDMDLPRLIKQYNEEGHEQIIKFATPETLKKRVFEKETKDLPIMRGDWSDYWNFGSASTARETKISRCSKELIRKAEVLSTVNGKTDNRYKKVVNDAYLNAMLYEEHTWGASQSVTDPNDIEVYSQEVQKKIMAYEFADMSTLAIFKQLEAFTKNPIQSMNQDGIIVVNTSDVPKKAKLYIPNDYRTNTRHISYQRIKELLPFDLENKDKDYYGTITMPAFSSRKITFTELDKMKANLKPIDIKIFDDKVITPFYEILFQKEKGRIIQVIERQTNRKLLDEESEYTLFEPIEESLDLRYHENIRETFFPRDIDLANHSISVWNHDWKAKRSTATEVLNYKVYIEAGEVVFDYNYNFPTTKSMNQKIKFSSQHNRIMTDVKMDKEKIETPDSTYLAVPLKLSKDWDCSFDTAGTFVKLDEEQIGATCRDWVTVENTISMYTKDIGFTLACPDAPMVQTNGFRFGLESKAIERTKNPLLLAWPMNNYWNTNFVAAQPGIVNFEYELTPILNFSEKNIKELGIEAKHPCLIYPIVDATFNKTMDIIEYQSEDIFVERLSTDLDKDFDILVLLKNYSKEKANASIKLKTKLNILSAQKENTAGVFIQSASIIDGVIKAELNGYEMAYIRISTNKK